MSRGAGESAKSLEISGKNKRKLCTGVIDLSHLTSVSCNSILNAHRMEGGSPDYQNNPEDASLPEQAVEDRMSDGLM